MDLTEFSGWGEIGTTTRGEGGKLLAFWPTGVFSVPSFHAMWRREVLGGTLDIAFLSLAVAADFLDTEECGQAGEIQKRDPVVCFPLNSQGGYCVPPPFFTYTHAALCHVLPTTTFRNERLNRSPLREQPTQDKTADLQEQQNFHQTHGMIPMTDTPKPL